MKIVINRQFGGFSLSDEAIKLYSTLKDLKLFQQTNNDGVSWVSTDGQKITYFEDYYIPRDDPSLVQVVEALGEKSSGHYAKLVVVTIPDDVDWYIRNYDGMETVEEKHRSWP